MLRCYEQLRALVEGEIEENLRHFQKEVEGV